MVFDKKINYDLRNFNLRNNISKIRNFETQLQYLGKNILGFRKSDQRKM